jgi:putative sigma-54 modulation protein
MRVTIRTVDVRATEALKQHVQQVVSAAFDRIGDHVHELEVRLRDLNGPKGGVDQEVVVLGRLAGKTLAVRAVEADAYHALRSAITRMARRVRARRGGRT